MYSIEKDVENIIEIKKSKFITKLYKINNVDEVNNILSIINKEFKDSTHICFAYILPNTEKCSDDGEPSGTAGLPILNVLKKKNLTNILAIVIRYFGGIKLGAGGLVRAYSNSITETLKLTPKIELIEGYLVEIEFSYDKLKLIDHLLNNKNIVEKKYENNIIYNFYLSKDELEFINSIEKNVVKITVKDKILIKK